MTSRHEKMRGARPVFWGCLAVVLFSTACSQQTPPDTRAADESAIRDLDSQWSKAAAANDLDAAVSYYTDDASMLPPNAPIAVGKAAIRASWASFLVPGASVSWQPDKVEVARSGDLAYSMGVYQSAMKDPQGRIVSDHGKYVEVWKKQPDDKWKTVSDIFNSDLPAPPPEKKTHEPRRHAHAAAKHKKHHR
jgi:uncharacterized protein (TIGR02246 family)